MDYTSDVILAMSDDGEDSFYEYLEADRELELNMTEFIKGHELNDNNLQDHVWLFKNVDCDLRFNPLIATLFKLNSRIPKKDYRCVIIPKDMSMISARIPWQRLLELLKE